MTIFICLYLLESFIVLSIIYIFIKEIDQKAKVYKLPTSSNKTRKGAKK